MTRHGKMLAFGAALVFLFAMAMRMASAQPASPEVQARAQATRRKRREERGSLRRQVRAIAKDPEAVAVAVQAVSDSVLGEGVDIAKL